MDVNETTGRSLTTLIRITKFAVFDSPSFAQLELFLRLQTRFELPFSSPDLWNALGAREALH